MVFTEYRIDDLADGQARFRSGRRGLGLFQWTDDRIVSWQEAIQLAIEALVTGGMPIAIATSEVNERHYAGLY